MRFKLFLLLALLPFIALSNNYNKAFDVLIKYEGDIYHDNPKDPGGPTKFGWTLKSYRQTVNRQATIRTIQNLSREEAKELYKKYWWKKYGASQIHDQELAVLVLLAQVNMGPSVPNSVLQDAVNDLCDYNLRLDGVLGSDSIKAINNCDRAEEGFPYYLNMIAADNPNARAVWKWAKKGLRNRMFHYRDLHEIEENKCLE